MPLTIVRNVNDDMKVMQEEIFGPILPVMTYSSIDEAIDYVNDHDRPLGLYYFGQDKAEEEKVLSRTISAGRQSMTCCFTMRWKICPLAVSDHRAWAIIMGPMASRLSAMRAVYRQPGMDARLCGLQASLRKSHPQNAGARVEEVGCRMQALALEGHTLPQWWNW